MSKSTTPQNNNKGQESATLPVLCAGGCNFYGNPAMKNCCSLCFKKLYPSEYEELNTETEKKKTKIKTSNNKNNEEQKNDSNNNDNGINKEKEKEDDKPKKKVQKKKNRCWNCRKKISLAGQFECKCGYVFCSMHRYPDAHECDFDYKKQNQEILDKQNKSLHLPNSKKFKIEKPIVLHSKHTTIFSFYTHFVFIFELSHFSFFLSFFSKQKHNLKYSFYKSNVAQNRIYIYKPKYLIAKKTKEKEFSEREE